VLTYRPVARLGHGSVDQLPAAAHHQHLFTRWSAAACSQRLLDAGRAVGPSDRPAAARGSLLPASLHSARPCYPAAPAGPPAGPPPLPKGVVPVPCGKPAPHDHQGQAGVLAASIIPRCPPVAHPEDLPQGPGRSELAGCYGGRT